MKIPFMNLARQNEKLRDSYVLALNRLIDSSGFILGEYVAAFETDFAAFQQTRYCVGTTSGTTALHLALHACGIMPGDEVITAANTFAATAEAIIHCGAKPVFVDVDPENYHLDTTLIERAITPKTKAIIPVHLYGALASMDRICEIAQKNGLYVIEDAAQAHGAELDGKRAGAFGKAAAFSFYPGKNLGALGDAGCVVTNDEELYKQMIMLRNHGTSSKYNHEIVGFNYRMDALTGALLNIKLPFLEGWTEARIENSEKYRQLLKGIDLKLPVKQNNSRHVFYVFVVELEGRDQLINYLSERGIQAIIHYPVPLHLQPAFTHLGYSRGDFPVAERAAERILSLPLCAEISFDEIEYTCEAVKDFFNTSD